MPWLKAGDNAATHTMVMALATVVASDDRTMNEVFGFVVRCAMQSAGHMTDYQINAGTAALLGGTRTKKLLRQAVEAGLMTEHGTGRAKFWRLVEDPEFLHIRLREEVEWDRQRRKDAANPDLTIPVRLRDGDSCRYCGQIVYWRNKKGARGGTYDHRVPGQAATYDTYVVACRSCNSKRSDTITADADKDVPLLPAPARPFYHEETIALLAKHGQFVQSWPHEGRPARPDETATDTAHSDPGAAAPDTAPARPGATSDTAHAPQERPDGPSSDTATSSTGQDPSICRSQQTDRVRPGTGRVGPGRAGPGQDGPGLDGPGQVGRQPAVRQGGDLPRTPSGEQSSSTRRRGRRGSRR